MGDPLSVTASVIGILGLVGKVISSGYEIYQYYEDVKKAPKDIEKLMDELQSLIPVLTALRDYATTDPQLKTLQMLNGPRRPLQVCEQELQDLKQKLKPRKKLKGVMNALRWPLQEKETLRYISVIERHKNLFNLALAMDHM